MADGRHIENRILVLTRLHIVRLRRNLEFGGLIARVQRFCDFCQISKMQHDGRHLENRYISISQLRIVRIARDFVCRHKFYRRRRKRQKSEIGKFKMADGRRIKNHFWL